MNRVLQMRLVAFAIGCIGAYPAAAAPNAANGRLEPRQVIERSQSVIGRNVGAYRLMDTKGASLLLASLRDKPLVISLVYSSCSSVCPVTTQRLIDAVTFLGRIVDQPSLSSLFAMLVESLRRRQRNRLSNAMTRRPRGEDGHEDLRCRWFVPKRSMW